MTALQGVHAARLVLLLVLAGVFVALMPPGRPLSRRLRAVIFALAAVALVAYPNFGLFHATYGPVHYWDAFHYFMGAKYFPEVGYTRLYQATYVAGRELGAFADVTVLRDLESYQFRPVATVDAPAVRARFAPERWRDFKRDLAFFGPRIPEWPGPILDHGYNDPPPRALLLHVVTRWLPANRTTVGLLTSVDYVLVAAAFAVVGRAFGAVPAALAFAFVCLSFFARFDFVGGAVLRWDWIAALLAGVAAFARGAGTTAGLLLGYASLARIFPVLFLLPLALKWLHLRRGQRDAVTGRALVAALALMAVVGLGLLALGERAHLGEFVAKIGVHSANPSLNALGLGALLTFTAAPWSLNPDGSVFVPHAAALAARPRSWVLGLAGLLYLLAAAPLILRARPLTSLLYAVPLVYWLLSPSGYYYSFLVLLVLLPWHEGRPDPARLAGMALLCVVMAASYAAEIGSADMLPLYYQASIQLALFFVVWLAFEWVRRAWPVRA